MNVGCAFLPALWLLQAQRNIGQFQKPVVIGWDGPVVPAALAPVAFKAVVGSDPEIIAFRLLWLAFSCHGNAQHLSIAMQNQAPKSAAAARKMLET